MNDLYEITNPVFNTAKMTLTLLSSVGNEDAAAFERVLGFEKMPHVEGQAAEIELLGKIGAITIEMRYALANRMIEAAGNKNVLDLACGYTPRAKYLMDKGYRYVGGDLPAVAEDMTRVSDELLDGKAQFRVVDVTNGASVREAADQLPGPVTISSEGLLAYLSKDEVTAMVRNFAAVLREHGGCWVTTDFESDSYFMVIIQAVASGMGEHFMELVNSQVKKKTADAEHAPVFANDDEKLAFLRDMGLKVERRPITGLEDMGLRTLYALAPEQRTAIMKALEKINVWSIAPDEKYVGEDAGGPEAASRKAGKPEAARPAGLGTGGLEIDASLEGDALTLRLGGRMDSISAPQLLGEFQAITAKGAVREITLDLAKLEYTSSAGLRVMLIMYKHVGEGHFRLLHVNETIGDILENTGFREIFTP